MIRNYFFNFAEDSIEANFLKIKDSGNMIVITSDALDSVTQLPKGLHTTFHGKNPEQGYFTSIIQTRVGRGGRKILKVTGDESAKGSLHGTLLDLSDIDWSIARKFQRKPGDNVIRFDRPFVSGVLTVYFIIVNDSGKVHSLEGAIHANEILALVPTDDGAVSAIADHTLFGRFPRTNNMGYIDWAVLSVEGKNIEIEKAEGKEMKVEEFAAFAPGEEKIVE